MKVEGNLICCETSLQFEGPHLGKKMDSSTVQTFQSHMIWKNSEGFQGWNLQDDVVYILNPYELQVHWIIILNQILEFFSVSCVLSAF